MAGALGLNGLRPVNRFGDLCAEDVRGDVAGKAGVGVDPLRLVSDSAAVHSPGSARLSRLVKDSGAFTICQKTLVRFEQADTILHVS